MKTPTQAEVRAACAAVTKAAQRLNADLVFTPATVGLAGAVRPRLGELREALQHAEQLVAAVERSTR